MTHQTITFTANEIENIQEMTDVNMHQTAAATVLFKLAKDGTTVTQDFLQKVSEAGCINSRWTQRMSAQTLLKTKKHLSEISKTQ